MECLWACAALESQRMKCARLVCGTLIGVAAAVAASAFGHGCEFLLCRVDVNDGRIRLQVTADLAGNPLIHSEEEAAHALGTSLQVRVGEELHALTDLGRLTLEKRSVWDADAPVVGAPLEAGQAHELLTAVWDWVPNSESVSFFVPKGNLHDVLLWHHADGMRDAQNPKWTLLIEGESSPLIQVPRARLAENWKWQAFALVLIFLGALFLICWRRKAFHVPRRLPNSSM